EPPANPARFTNDKAPIESGGEADLGAEFVSDPRLALGDAVDLPGKSGEHQLRNQEVFDGKREQADAGISA
ncbi:hypothetical protein, partial [Paracoccus sp. DMF]|uniref:hypothetical protein n=1 Tax=Paracoccus sp. DMF TaxID=400837 RepID=UPI0021E3A971